MATFLYLFKNDTSEESSKGDVSGWNHFIDKLAVAEHFVGGGPLGAGCVRKRESTIDEVSEQFGGYMVITAGSLQEAAALLDDCPTIQSGGSVEVREVPEV